MNQRNGPTPFLYSISVNPFIFVPLVQIFVYQLQEKFFQHLPIIMTCYLFYIVIYAF